MNASSSVRSLCLLRDGKRTGATRPLCGVESRVILLQVIQCPAPFTCARARNATGRRGRALRRSYSSAFAHSGLARHAAWVATLP